MMENTRRYTPTNSRLFTWLVVRTYGAVIRRIYRARAIGLERIAALEPPYIVVANHSMILDPFMINAFIGKPIHWVAADGNMRNPILRFLLLKLVGAIPKSKAIPDMETIGWIMRIIRERKGIVGVFPEGQANWNGITAPSIPATAKLLKLLKAPVVGVRMMGFHTAKPRWSYVIRRVPTEADFQVILTRDDLRRLSVEEIGEKVDGAIRHDEWAWSRSCGTLVSHPKRAECLELALYLCPRCDGVGTLRSRGAAFGCEACGYGVELAETMEFVPRAPGFATILEWDRWQAERMAVLIGRWRDSGSPARNDAFMSDEGVVLKRGRRMDTMETLGKGRLEFLPRGLCFTPAHGAPIVFPIGKVEGAGVLKWNFLEFYVGKDAYRAVFPGRSVSARKWADAIALFHVPKSPGLGEAPFPGQRQVADGHVD